MGGPADQQAGAVGTLVAAPGNGQKLGRRQRAVLAGAMAGVDLALRCGPQLRLELRRVADLEPRIGKAEHRNLA